MKASNAYLILFLCFAVVCIDAVAAKRHAKAPVDYTTAQVWSIETIADKTATVLKDLEISHDINVWKSNATHTDLLVKPSVLGKVSRIFDAENIRYSVLIPDLQEKINAERPRQVDEKRQYKLTHNLNWTSYHGTRDIYRFLQHLAWAYPHLCSIHIIGYTAERRQLKVIRISNGKQNPAIWIDGGLHAQEWITTASLTYIINDLVKNWKNQSAVIQNISWYIQPLVNPDGYEYTRTVDRLWRKNRSGSGDCVGVDLNRNYDFQWGGSGASNDPCSNYYQGAKAFSEAETKSQKDFFQRIDQDFYGFVTFHNYGQRILYPWAFNASLTVDHKELDAVGRMAAEAMYTFDRKKYTVGPAGILGYPAAGTASDWAKYNGTKYAYSVELRDTGEHGFIQPPSQIIPVAEEAYHFIRTLATAVRNHTT